MLDNEHEQTYIPSAQFLGRAIFLGHSDEIVFSFSRFLVFLLVFSSPLEAQEEIVVSGELQRSLTILGTIELGDSKSNIFSLGDVYAGKPIRGKVVVQNKTSNDLVIKDVVTSCGCTAAYPRESKIASGSPSEILIELVPKKAESFGVKIRILTDAGEFPFVLRGRSQARIVSKNSELSYRKDADNIELEFEIKDPDISPKSLKMAFNGKTLKKIRSEQANVSFSLPTSLVKPAAYTNLIPIIDGKEGDIILIRIQQAGLTKLVTDQIYGTGDPYVFRLFITGDIQFPSSESQTQLCIGEKEFPVAIRVSAKKRSALVQCTSKTPLSGDATLMIGEQTYSFTLNKR